MTTPHWMQRVCHRGGYVARDTRDAGFTLIEALVSFVIFAIVATSTATGIFNALRASRTSQQRVDASHVAQFFISVAIQKAATDQTIPLAGVTSTPYVGDTSDGNPEPEQFTVIQTVTFDTGDTCAPGKLFTVNIEVHQKQTNKYLARSDARVACPPA